MPEFPKTTSMVTSWSGRYILGRRSVTEILSLDENGNRITKYDPGWFGVYVRKGERWELHGEPFPTSWEADAAAARYRRNLRAELSDA